MKRFRLTFGTRNNVSCCPAETLSLAVAKGKEGFLKETLGEIDKKRIEKLCNVPFLRKIKNWHAVCFIFNQKERYGKNRTGCASGNTERNVPDLR